MIDRGYSRADALVYSRIWWFNYKHSMDKRIVMSEDVISADCRLSRRQVSDSINKLETNWLLSVYRRWVKKRNNYAVTSLDNYPCAIEYYTNI